MSDLTIRPAGLADAAALATLIAGFRDHLAAEVPSDAEIQRDLPRALRDPGIEFGCAWLDGAAVGYTQTRFFTSVWAGGTEAHLDDLFVVPLARGREVGRSLLRHALARAQARGALRFGLHTNERNDGAQSLYRSEGLAPQSHALYPGGREVFWVKRISADDEPLAWRHAMETEAYQGGCLCGAVRFRVSGAHTNPCICHCRSCRGAAGAPFVAWATFPTRAFQVTRGELRFHRSSERVRRGFCAACGSALTYAHDARPDELDVAAVMLDDPGAIPPEFHLWVSHKLPWVVLEDGLPRYQEWRTSDG